MLEAEGHQGSNDRCATHADVPEANTLGLFVTLVPGRRISLPLDTDKIGIAGKELTTWM